MTSSSGRLCRNSGRSVVLNWVIRGLSAFCVFTVDPASCAAVDDVVVVPPVPFGGEYHPGAGFVYGEGWRWELQSRRGRLTAPTELGLAGSPPRVCVHVGLAWWIIRDRRGCVLKDGAGPG